MFLDEFAAGINAYGTTLVGFPDPIIAFNDYLGWTHTVNTFDGHDEYTLRLGDGGYYYDGEIRPFEVDSQTVLVRTGDAAFSSRSLVVRRSIHGPVIAKGEDRAIALRITGLGAHGVFDQYWDMLRARNLQQFEDAVSQLQMPMFTTMYADRDGHIMHLFGGRTPVRPDGDWRVWSGYVPGDSSSTLWTEFHPYEDLPRVIDPESGWLQNANDPPWTTTFPRAIDPADYPPYMAPRRMPFRPQRSARMLAEDEEISFEETIEYKLSTRMELADRLLDDLIAAARDHGDRDARAAADVLAAWDRNADADSRGAVLFGVWLSRMKPARLFATPWSPERARDTPTGLADPEEAAGALGWAARETKKRFSDLAVAWGEVYRLRYGDYDYAGNGGPGGFGIFRVIGYSQDDDGLFRSTSGDSYVAIVEFTDPVRAVAVMSYGNATQAHTGHVGDQLRLLAEKEMRVIWRTRAEIEANLESRTVF